jgi:formylglycine-generating enzyme required for sulfatase activity
MRTLVALILDFAGTVAVFPQEKYALVIGNAKYTGVTPLRNTVNDANDMESALKSLDWTVDKVLDGSLEAMENAVARFKARLSGSRGSYGLFFYSGHGVQSGGENYLIPVDANIPAESYLRVRALSAQVVLEELTSAGNELNVVILDACRDNPFSWKRSGSRGLAVMTYQPAGSIVVFATSSGSVASDGVGRNGLFTTHFLNNLKKPGLEVSELFRQTGADVARASGNQQLPELHNKYYQTAYLGSRPGVTPAPAPASSGFVRIPGGTFTMGSPASEPGRDDDEVQHRVTVGSFSMGKYEVTQKEWREVMGSNPSDFKGDNLPVENVSWYDAIEYCNRRSQREGLTPAYTIDKTRVDPNNRSEYDDVKWIVTWNKNANGYRLPTEAEWEYACRAGTSTPFSTGNNITTSQANYDGDYPYNGNAEGVYRGETWAVGSGAANAWGLYDMHGNVWEWCWDWYGAYAGAQTDPAGAMSGTYRVQRGGSCISPGEGVRSAVRTGNVPVTRGVLGFRLVCNAD